MLNQTDLRTVTADDLRRLHANQVAESHTLDYKRDFPLDREGRVSLASDVVAFANTRGGDLLLGVEEKEGVISRFVPIQLEDRDAALLSLQSALADLIEPKVPGVHLAAIPMDDGYVVVVRTPLSFQAPHRVRKTGVFYTRTSTGIDPMDITTLRSAFLQSAGAADRAKQFRERRIAEMYERPLPAVLPRRAYGVLHVLPMAAVLGTTAFDIHSLDVIARTLRPPVTNGGFSPRINLDGAMSYSGAMETVAYTQLFRDGSIESVMPVQASLSGEVAWIGGFEDALVREHHASLVKALNTLGLDGPAFIMLSFVDIGGRALEHENSVAAAMAGSVARIPDYYQNLMLPEVFVDSFVGSEPEVYGQLFDLVWNAAGRASRPSSRR